MRYKSAIYQRINYLYLLARNPKHPPNKTIYQYPY